MLEPPFWGALHGGRAPLKLDPAGPTARDTLIKAMIGRGPYAHHSHIASRSGAYQLRFLCRHAAGPCLRWLLGVVAAMLSSNVWFEVCRISVDPKLVD